MRFSDDVWIGFFSELEKRAYDVDPKAFNERLRIGSGPLWAAGGALAGMAAGREAFRRFGPKAFWPVALFAALPAGLAAHLAQKLYSGGTPEDVIAERMLARRTRATPTTTG